MKSMTIYHRVLWRAAFSRQCDDVGARDGAPEGAGLRGAAAEGGSGVGCGVCGPALSGVADGWVQPSCCTQVVIICLVSGDQPASGALVAMICLVVSP